MSAYFSDHDLVVSGKTSVVSIRLDFNCFEKILLYTIFSYKNTDKLINSFCFQNNLTIVSTAKIKQNMF